MWCMRFVLCLWSRRFSFQLWSTSCFFFSFLFLSHSWKMIFINLKDLIFLVKISFSFYIPWFGYCLCLFFFLLFPSFFLFFWWWWFCSFNNTWVTRVNDFLTSRCEDSTTYTASTCIVSSFGIQLVFQSFFIPIYEFFF